MEPVSQLVTNQKSFTGNTAHMVVICDVAQPETMAAVSDYLEKAGYLVNKDAVHLMAPAVFGNAAVQSLLAQDQQYQRTSFVVIKDGTQRHYFKKAYQADFSIHVTRFQ